MSYLALPTKNKKRLAEALNEAITSAESWLNLAYIEWFMIHHYLQGARDFLVPPGGWTSGEVHVSYETETGELEFRYEGLVKEYQTECSIYMKMDTTPIATTEGFGALDAVRNAGIANATLRYMWGGINSEQLKSRAIQLWVKYGTVGLYHYRHHGRNIRDRTVIEVVPPWELLPIPAEIHHLGDQRGVIRRRLVPLLFLREELGFKLTTDDSKLGVMEYEPGSVPNRYGALDLGGSSPSGALSAFYSGQGEVASRERGQSQVSRRGRKSKDLEKWVYLDEVWTFHPKERVHNYIIKVGEHIEGDPREWGMEENVVCPLAVARFIPTGRFYGRSYIGYRLGLNDENEKMLSRLFRNVSDFDEYGFLMFPSTSGITRQQITQQGNRKILFFEPDPLTPNVTATNIAPANSGDAAGKVAQMGIQLQDKLSGQGELYSGNAPGRVDSASGLGFLYETGNISRVVSSSELADMYQQINRHMLQEAREESSGIEQAEPEGSDLFGLQAGAGTSAPAAFVLPALDDRMVGVTIGPGGQISLDKNPIPEPFDVAVDISDRLPTSKLQQRQEAKELLQVGQITPVEFRILNFRENLGFPIPNRAEWEAYRKGVYKKILYFNDGETPNISVPINTEADHAEIELAVCMEMMHSIEFTLASREVRQVFEEWKNELELMMGKIPEGLPYPEQAAEMMQMRQRQGGAGAGAGPSPRTMGSPGGNRAGRGVPR